MNHRCMKKEIAKIVKSFFTTANVVWGRTKQVTPNVPQVTLTTLPVNRPIQSIRETVNGVIVDFYPTTTKIQIDLETKGVPTSTAPGVSAAYENTAISDLYEFINYLNSQYVLELSNKLDIAIYANNVLDLTELVNSTNWDYRAMVELEVNYTQGAVGMTGMMYEEGMPYHENGRPMFDSEGYPLDENGVRIPGMPRLPLDDNGEPILPPMIPSSSRGGNPELAKQTTGFFDEIENPQEIQ